MNTISILKKSLAFVPITIAIVSILTIGATSQVTASAKVRTRSTKTSQIAKNTMANNTQFVAGTCLELKKLGMGNFQRGDVNYTPARDRDKDGIACEK